MASAATTEFLWLEGKWNAVMLKKQTTTLIRFCTVGVGNTLIDFCVFFLLTAVYVPYLIAQVCSYTAGIANSYIWNRIWTFEVKKKPTNRKWFGLSPLISQRLVWRFCCYSVFKQPDCLFSSANWLQLSAVWSLILSGIASGSSAIRWKIRVDVRKLNGVKEMKKSEKPSSLQQV